jgi:uncharacterized protein (DUF433 family)
VVDAPKTVACEFGLKDVFDLLATGVPQAESLEDFPYLEAEDILARLEYTPAEADHPVILAR